jgi:NAD(P)-dependent dehydrogenase (short-subunit alcohol dehydrogenase family)
MDLNLPGKAFFVTGAASGIGASAVDLLVAAGANVAACDRDRAGLERLKTKGDSVLPVYADLAEKSDIHHALQGCRDRFGRIDSLLHFGGILDRHQIDDVTVEMWDKVIAVNLRGTFLVVQAVAPIMREQKSGRIVLTASDSARMGSLVSGPAYAASKGGVIALTHSFALNLGKFNITCNAVCPGLVMTGMSSGWEQEIIDSVKRRTPMGRLATAAEVARVAIFLGSDAANFMNGEVVEVNGGIHFD